MARHFLPIITSSAFLCGCIIASPKDERHRDGQVLSVDERPCFTIGSGAEEGRASSVWISMVDVYEHSGGRAESIWRVNYIPDEGGGFENWRLLDGCVEYAGGAGQAGKVLSAGKAYSASLSVILNMNGESLARTYRSYFCMREEGGSLRAQQVQRDDRTGGWDWSACDKGR